MEKYENIISTLYNLRKTKLTTERKVYSTVKFHFSKTYVQ